MRWATALSLLWLSKAHALDTPLILWHDPIRSSTATSVAPQTINPAIARLIFAHRLGLSHFYKLGNVEDSTIQLLNAYGGPAASGDAIFAAETAGIFAIVEGVDEVSDHTRRVFDAFGLDSSPSSAHNEELFDIFRGQTQLQAKRRPDSVQPKKILDPPSSMRDVCRGNWDILGMSVLARLNCPTDPNTFHQFMTTLLDLSAKADIPLTVIVSPTTPRNAAKHDDDPYALKHVARVGLDKRQEAVILEEGPTTSMAEGGSPLVAQEPSTKTKFPLAPSCYASLDDCQTGTQNCTGHGSCVQKGASSGKSERDLTPRAETNACFLCSCEAQVVKNDDGSTSTTFYGGSACQKIDVSAPFWILTLTGGSLFALVGFGVSMLYAMGNQELPSVIGAGVSGPRASK